MTAAGPKKLMVVIGTRPEAIKLAPIILEAARRSKSFLSYVVTTSQHREMLDQMLDEFGIDVAVDLDIMKPDQDLCHVTTAALEGLNRATAEIRPDFVIVQGDTSTTFAGALAAFYHKVPVAHVEAGLRTYDKTQPFPEEINRCLTTQLADLHFAPTESARQNLLREGVTANKIWVTGNTSIDALFHTLNKVGGERESTSSPRTILLTAHRRENHGEPMERICDAVLRLLDLFPDLHVIYPVHLSPRVRRTVFDRLGGRARVELKEPMDYGTFILAMSRAHLIMSDSGGVQEEAPSLGKPVLVLRDTTERPEAVAAGTCSLVGSDVDRIVEKASHLLRDDEAYRAVSQAVNPFGDGRAAERILEVLARVG